MHQRGTVKTWNDDRGFGFLRPDPPGADVFFHISAYSPPGTRPSIGESVRFDVETGPQGKPRARHVEALRSRTAPPPPRRVRPRSAQQPERRGGVGLAAIPVFLVLYVFLTLHWSLPSWPAGVYGGMSLVSYIAYGIDKSAAVHGAQRTPESHLHWLALLGGWPGALMAQYFLRHKSIKAEFRAVFWITVVLNVAAFVGFCSSYGRAVWAKH